MQILDKEKEYEYFKKKVFELTQIDLNAYKTHQIQRRLPFVMSKARAKNYVNYANILREDPIQLKQFVDWLTINVSEFFRDFQKFEELKKEILPKLLKRVSKLKIWSAGCSNGAEPYSVAMVLDELTPYRRHEIIATDLDEKILNSARKGCYSLKDVRNVPAKLLDKFFIVDGEGVELKEEIKKRVVFKKHNLLKGKYETDFDLILCRNVVIYFTEESKRGIYGKFYSSLKSGGFLFAGNAESILGASVFGFEMFMPSFYLKPE